MHKYAEALHARLQKVRLWCRREAVICMCHTQVLIQDTVSVLQECDDHIAAQLQRLADTQASDPVVFLEQVLPYLSLLQFLYFLLQAHWPGSVYDLRRKCVVCQVEATWEDMCQQMLTIRQVLSLPLACRCHDPPGAAPSTSARAKG
jgi:hypothetical protein